MIAAKSLALYKNRPALVLEVGKDRLEIKLEDGQTVKVRDKDLELLHPGPVTAIPAPAQGGDFETARAMAESGLALPLGELAELVFGSAGPAELLACWKEGLEGLRFRQTEGGLQPLSDAELAKETERRAKKESEAAERAAFVERAKKARGRKPDAAEAAFLPGDERFLAEIEALALGRSQKCKVAGEIGLAEEPEAAQAFLLRAGRWTDAVNPHGSRAGCALSAPRLELGPEAPGPERLDLTGLESWAIDNAWSHDPDDAIGFDGESVWVHVADPAAVILPDSAADKEALGRGATLYLPELTAPMLPDEALERFGLGLAERSPALSFQIRLDETAGVVGVEIHATSVRVRRTHYAEADGILERGESPALAALARLAELRTARRLAEGAIEIDIPEVRPYLVDGEIRIDPVPATRSSGIVREMMLLAGEAAARWAFERKLAFPFYGQEAPSEPGAEARGDELSAQFARRRLMRAGISGPTPTAHRGLGLAFYAQSTSPLRRYQDLLGHMQIRAILAGREPLSSDEVQRRCALAQAAQSGTKAAERASDLHWAIVYLLRHPGWEGEGVIVGQAGPASVVYLPELGLETKLKLGPGRGLDERLRLKVARLDLAALESSFDEVR
ncbi:MAG: RNB domain-containing ribonuclease [Spirochaetaceae bacterium]|nr:RNB domain-containing ribonuclease [Spirochaetaceae bacterium]